MENIAPNRIKEMRLKRGMSLSELSELTGLTRSELHKLEKGVRRIRTDHLPPLSRSLRCSAEELLNPELAEQLVEDRLKYMGTADGKDGPTAIADLPVLGIKEGDGSFNLDEAQPQAFVQRIPLLFNVKTSYAIYMPDSAMEPRVPAGAVAYINPVLPARAGDLAVVRQNDGRGVVVMLQHDREKGLVGIQENSETVIEIANENGARIQRIVGLSFM